MLMGRDIMKGNGVEAQSVMSMELLVGLEGKEKMSKSLDNYVGITEIPRDMFGKIMSITDSVIGTYFKLATYTPLSELEEIESKLSNGKENPRDIKARLAREVVAIYHGEAAALAAEKDFEQTFSKRGVPENIPVVQVSKDFSLVDILIEQGLVSSKTEFNRLMKAGAIEEKENGVYRIGKHRFLKIEIL